MTYMKSLGMVVATVLSAIVAAWTGGVTVPEWINIAIIGVAAAEVFAAPNVPGANYTKTILAVLAAVLTALTSMVTGGISTPELMQLAVVALGALGVYALPK